MLIPLQPQHMALIRPQAAQQPMHEMPPGEGWCFVVDGLPICCGGLVEIWTGRAYAWAYLDRDAGPHMLRLTRSIRSLLDASGFRRIEMAVDADFEAGLRWAELLGFKRETLARRYMPDGADAHIFVRV